MNFTEELLKLQLTTSAISGVNILETDDPKTMSLEDMLSEINTLLKKLFNLASNQQLDASKQQLDESSQCQLPDIIKNNLNSQKWGERNLKTLFLSLKEIGNYISKLPKDKQKDAAQDIVSQLSVDVWNDCTEGTVNFIRDILNAKLNDSKNLPIIEKFKNIVALEKRLHIREILQKKLDLIKNASDDERGLYDNTPGFEQLLCPGSDTHSVELLSFLTQDTFGIEPNTTDKNIQRGIEHINKKYKT